MDSCILDSQEIIESTAFSNLIFADSSKLIGFQILFPNLDYTLGIKCRDILDENSLIANNKIANGYRGIDLLNSNLKVVGNIISNVDRGINVDGFTFDYFPVIDNNIILYPSSIGIYDFLGCQPTITNNIIYLNNQYSRGLHDIVKTPLTANNIVISENDIYGGYSFIFSGNVRNNVLIGHTSAGRALHFSSGNFHAINNLVMNIDLGASIYGSVSMDFRHNNIWNVANPYLGFTPDSTNLSVDPMIVSEDSGDVHLQMYSPMIDAGDPRILDANGSRSDIGAYGGPLGKTYEYIDLPPRSPRGIVSSIDSGLVKISWKKNTEADLHKYRVYRDTTKGFVIDTTKLIAEIIDTVFEESLLNQQKNLYYKITAVDSQWNESAGSEEITVVISEVNEPIIITDDYHLYPNYPNPFNSTTKIGYRIKGTSYVKLIVYDIKGEIVRVLSNEIKEGGYYEEEFSAESKSAFGEGSASGRDADRLSSGIYIYRIYIRNSNDVPVYSASGKMLYLK
ncbi:MAG: right-handed parallel beta-helix repeat-containing protein [Ignavibacteriaceae bacterium]|nr:right-handed parallel beta-helix repeat-containing protein [Ignavibacteriaceae bacterium]